MQKALLIVLGLAIQLTAGAVIYQAVENLAGPGPGTIIVNAAPLPQIKKVIRQEAKINIREVSDKIYILESSGGRNDGCKRFGQVNGYGYRQNKDQYVCYKSHEEVRALVEKWLEKQLAIKSLPKALCYYNTGYAISSCQYYKNYLKLK